MAAAFVVCVFIDTFLTGWMLAKYRALLKLVQALTMGVQKLEFPEDVTDGE